MGNAGSFFKNPIIAKEAYEKALKQASLLEKAGIPFAFSTADAKPGDAMKAIQSMIKNGLSEKAAFAALTTNPASILGISRVAGSIEKGKMANLIVSTDAVFNEDAQIKHVIVDGNIFTYEVKKKAAKEEQKSTGAAGTSVRSRLLSISPVPPFCAATNANEIDSTMNKVANMVVIRVRKSAAPRADINPDGLPPIPKPPPSDRCIKITPTSEAATIA